MANLCSNFVKSVDGSRNKYSQVSPSSKSVYPRRCLISGVLENLGGGVIVEAVAFVAVAARVDDTLAPTIKSNHVTYGDFIMLE